MSQILRSGCLHVLGDSCGHARAPPLAQCYHGVNRRRSYLSLDAAGQQSGFTSLNTTLPTIPADLSRPLPHQGILRTKDVVK